MVDEKFCLGQWGHKFNVWGWWGEEEWEMKVEGICC